MRIFGLLSIALMGATTIAHYFGGGPEFYEPLRSSGISAHLIAGFSVIWHATTLLLLLMTIGLVILYRRANPPLFWLLFAMQIGFGTLFVAYGLSDLGSVTDLPQWIAFGAVAIFMLLAQYAPRQHKGY